MNTRASVLAALAAGLACAGSSARGQDTLEPANIRPASFLSQLDIDNDGVADAAVDENGDGLPDVDSDGDGLPNNWEDGDSDGRFVSFPAPTAIGPGTPSTFILARLPVTTRFDKADTDGDGLTDFVEVFGLKFIDDNGNGKLDFFFTDSDGDGRYDAGEAIDSQSEWLDANVDGMPSVGEYPLDNTNLSRNLEYDFDGFYFTDPTLRDTDGDGVRDGEDVDPLINPQTFGLPVGGTFTREGIEAADRDLDNDGLGNGSDFGNDTTGIVDFPSDISDLIDIFRSDLQQAGMLPESLIEELLGADWDGNGLFRLTDVRNFSATVDEDALARSPEFSELFFLGDPDDDANRHCFCSEQAAAVAQGAYGERGAGMGYQELLIPAARTQLFPDRRIWAILYAWRMPSFDIDGDGYVGAPDRLQDPHPFVGAGSGGRSTGSSTFDGQISLENFFFYPLFQSCGVTGLTLGLTLTVLAGASLVSRRRGSP